VIVKLYVPAVVGVPLKTPDVSDKPPGRAPLCNANVYGLVPPLPPKVCVVYATPTVPFGNVTGDTVMVGNRS
jgi:hypothetical protein